MKSGKFDTKDGCCGSPNLCAFTEILLRCKVREEREREVLNHKKRLAELQRESSRDFKKDRDQSRDVGGRSLTP